jgi:hypothetical protein
MAFVAAPAELSTVPVRVVEVPRSRRASTLGGGVATCETRIGCASVPPLPVAPKMTCPLGACTLTACAHVVGAGCCAAGTPFSQTRHIPCGTGELSPPPPPPPTRTCADSEAAVRRRAAETITRTGVSTRTAGEGSAELRGPPPHDGECCLRLFALDVLPGRVGHCLLDERQRGGGVDCGEGNERRSTHEAR